MSWQDYIDDSLIASGNVSGGALIGLDGNLWARSETLSRISREEIDNLIKGFTPEGLLQLRNNGCFIAQEKYMVIKGAKTVIHKLLNSSR
jgi:profilin